VVLEVNLHYLVGEAEHNGMSSSHPFFHIDDIFYLSFRKLFRANLGLISLWLLTSLKIASEVLKQCHFLLKLFGILCEGIFFANVLSITASSLIVIEMITIRV